MDVVDAVPEYGKSHHGHEFLPHCDTAERVTTGLALPFHRYGSLLDEAWAPEYGSVF